MVSMLTVDWPVCQCQLVMIICPYQDLEIAATFKINVSPAVLLKKLLDTDHVHVSMPLLH